MSENYTICRHVGFFLDRLFWTFMSYIIVFMDFLR